VAIAIHRIRLAGRAASGCADDALRELLAAELGRAPEIVRGEHGKPELVGGELAFSVAHSGELAVIAISPRGPLGVDLEERRPMRDPNSFAKRFYTAGEAALVAADPDELYRLWCRKEAWSKAHGMGLRMPLDSIDLRAAPAGWLLVDLELAPGYAAAVACADVAAHIQIFERR
jgi:4'-phosphopantetheinyl transferase